nr:MAG TPA: hypothetical protein [Caudoviricetes sp.]
MVSPPSLCLHYNTFSCYMQAFIYNFINKKWPTNLDIF